MDTEIWNSNKNLIKVLKENGVVVMPTDTIYGIVGKAQNESTVNRIYAIRKRNPDKPCIILIGDMNELEKFSVFPTEEQKIKLKEFWPGPVSVILDCAEEKFSYLHRGTKTLAFRIPAPKALKDLLLKVGPLIAPSANTEATPPPLNIIGAKKYFGNQVDMYVDGGVIEGKPSKIIKLHKNGTIDILRK
jgi:L-threonylcarbamoyladenylate synthase